VKGWKTLVGGIIAIGLGFYTIVTMPEKFEWGAGLVAIGLMGLGVGHKIDKMQK
jgi:hypothetical protein